MERTFSIIKPDATKRNITGSINSIIEDSGLRIVAKRESNFLYPKLKNFIVFIVTNLFLMI